MQITQKLRARTIKFHIVNIYRVQQTSGACQPIFAIKIEESGLTRYHMCSFLKRFQLNFSGSKRSIITCVLEKEEFIFFLNNYQSTVWPDGHDFKIRVWTYQSFLTNRCHKMFEFLIWRRNRKTHVRGSSYFSRSAIAFSRELASGGSNQIQNSLFQYSVLHSQYLLKYSFKEKQKKRKKEIKIKRQ